MRDRALRPLTPQGTAPHTTCCTILLGPPEGSIGWYKSGGMLLDEMSELLDRHARTDRRTAVEGVQACRFDRTAPPAVGMSGTVLAVIAQGGKRLALGITCTSTGEGSTS